MAQKIPSYAKEFKKHTVMIFDDTNSMTLYPVFDIDDQTIEYENGMLPLNECKKVFDNNNSGFIYIFNLDTPAKVESANLRSLRRSASIKNLMTFERDGNSFDLMKAMPYIVAIVALLF